jgi:cysteine dioxygenase
MTADKLQTIHRLYNNDERAVSIHIYSRPIDSCVAFDMEKQHCYRRELAYFSKHGVIEPKPEAGPAPKPNLVTITAR